MAKEVCSPVVIRPKEVEYAIKLMLTATALGALVGYLNIPTAPGQDYFQAYIYLIFLGVLINIYFVYNVSRNKDWARKFYIILTLVTFLVYLPQLLAIFVAAPLNGVLQFIDMSIQVLAVYFLMRQESKNWFLLIKKGKRL
ncbi:MAG TPA: hypothetical protein GX523_10275 [Desulfitobacterium dehalogenans]|uniref:Uncharacterized protein n=1 Tax=Desulfitobacterium dehalogenans TaxID=36854 RepID=A0A7C7D609_9FIRM|nr:hypothetical protein [Desulfitobacterium dehalogenans]